MKKRINNNWAIFALVILFVLTIFLSIGLRKDLLKSPAESLEYFIKSDIEVAPEICENRMDDNFNGEIDENCPPPKIIATASVVLDGFTVDTKEEWDNAIRTYVELNEIGFTHVGVTVFDPESNVQEKINQLREHGLKIHAHFSNIGSILINEYDPSQHISNGQNLKFYDSIGFDPNFCSPWCDNVPDIYCDENRYIGPPELEEDYPRGCLCNAIYSNRAIDPAYSGSLWQEEISSLRSRVQRFGQLLPQDIASYNIEIWGIPPYIDRGDSSYNQCYPGTFINSAGRYSGSIQQKHQQYLNYWRARSNEITEIIRENNRNVFVFGFDERVREPNWQSQAPWNYVGGWIPPGSGDFANPELYFVNDIRYIEEYLSRDDYSSSYPWISFSFYSGSYRNERWDPKITQKVGYLFRQEGIPGVFVYNSPFSIGSTAETTEGVENFIEHARAFMDGFENGIDVQLNEVCGDLIDNDGDIFADENCPVADEVEYNQKI